MKQFIRLEQGQLFWIDREYGLRGYRVFRNQYIECHEPLRRLTYDPTENIQIVTPSNIIKLHSNGRFYPPIATDNLRLSVFMPILQVFLSVFPTRRLYPMS